MEPNDSTFDMSTIREIFRRHRGEAAKLARKLDVHESHVSMVLSGQRKAVRNGKSLKIMRALAARAAELLAEEEKAARANERRSRKKRNH